MVSTVGIPEAMLELSTTHPKVRIARSLHSAREGVRKSLIPLAKRYSLADLRAGIQRLPGTVMLEYLLLKGVNDQPEDLDALIHFAEGLSVHMNLIPFNPFDGTSFLPTPQPEREAFANALKEAGFKTTLRRSFGGDIDAACGQLASAHKEGKSFPPFGK